MGTVVNLGTIYEGQACPINVQAICTTGESVTYSLLPTSTLPLGLILDGTTGNIEGIVGHVPSNTYTFTIRASVGQTFLDQTFSLNVLARYASPSFVDLAFNLHVSDTIPMTAYYTTVIEGSDYFRPNDSNFGSLTSGAPLSMLIIGGLAGTPSGFGSIISASNFDAPVNLLLGNHQIAYGILNGVTVYEVLYRSVVDPMAGAGGYVVINGIPTQQPVIYPESLPAVPQIIYPNSIANIRDEFVTNVGFPTIDPTLANNLSLSAGAENLPLWMTCPQSGTDQTTALGYTPAVVIAYLAPGRGQVILNRILGRVVPAERPTDQPDPVRTGHQISFDQYFVVFQTVADETTFDNETTTFDNDSIAFDIVAVAGGNLYRMNRATS
jgi:hypothetical protein